ncbi:hypothetical protein C8A00DRAFT_41226 [Chaetomidium leptoderma]|uniref:R3H domain-containing protein n=1 Tax=Chaetomidium leptoderma TaxID=669021 RepID=A0AAN7A0Z6_9PEZI|nr:hypothetical protein C8A00DRAFT_41226 [Chaetomidium leptoderma]
MAAVPTMANDVRKMSFARVAAASAAKGSKHTATVARALDSAPVRDRREEIAPPSTAPPAAVPAIVPAVSPSAAVSFSDVQQVAGNEQLADSKMVTGLRDLKLEARAPLNLVVNGSVSGVAESSSKIGNSQTPSDDTSQRADSNSELGTKPPSLDGKSITSGTTFALDEKESLRPDDSASVKAAAEDDDAFSIRGSYMTGSRMGSDVAARIQRIQIGDMPPRVLPAHHILAGNKIQGLNTPQSGISDKQVVPDPKVSLVGGTATPDGLAPNAFYSQNPDEKLLEAMQSPKDRIFLLKLEQQVIEFVQDSKEPYMDLPPSNSFCRMLTHRLADYYHMTHSYEAAAGAVRIFRTPFCRIPPSLSSIATSTPSSSSPAPVVLPRKIMRRGEEGEFGSGSAAASKATSDAGSDSNKAARKEKLTREEREEAYNRARQRIFGSVEKSESSNQDGEDGNGVSRASSVSAKDKPNGGKRKPTKQRRDDSESFESRSQYVAWCGPQHPTWGPSAPQYYPVSTAPFNGGQFQQPYPNTPQPMYPPAQPYTSPMMPNNGFTPQYTGMPTYPAPPIPPTVPQTVPPPPQQAFRAPNPPMGGSYASPVPSISQPAWPPQQQGFSQTAAYPPRSSPVPPSGIPYLYGQLPAYVNPGDPKSQHPIPGSYSRQAFNPKTQSFVPGNGLPLQAPLAPPPVPGPYGGSSPRHGSPQFHSPHMAYSGFQQPLPQPGFGPPMPGPYGMTRQGSNHSMPPYHAVQQPPHVPAPHGPQHMPPSGPMHMPNKPAGPPGPGQAFSHLPNYGNPATLPQKPST